MPSFAPAERAPWRRRSTALRRALLARRRSLAAVLAGIAVFAGINAVRDAEPVGVPVLVAQRDLPAGTRLSDGDLVSASLPADSVPDGVVATARDRVLAAPLRRGEPLTDVRLVSPALARAQPGTLALPVRLPDAGMVALLRAGDTVTLLATSPADGQVHTVAEDVRVLAVPRELPDGPTGASGAALVVLEATHSEALAITSSALVEFLSVAL